MANELSSSDQPRSDSQLPSVAVVTITYNHEPFIAQSIESVFSQQYGGLIHLIIADDCSTDRTQEVITQTIPGAPANVIVHPVLRTSNVGMLKNLSDAWVMAHETGSSFIALLEGDDYWTDPWKLALQVDYLNQHPQATMSCGLISEINAFTDPPTHVGVVAAPPTPHPTFDDLLNYYFVGTATLVFRAGILPTLPEWFAECCAADWPLSLVHARAGDIHYLDRVLAAHRRHGGGLWFGIPAQERAKANQDVFRSVTTHVEPTKTSASLKHTQSNPAPWLAEVERDPNDVHAVFHLAQSYFHWGDFGTARSWYARRIDMGGDEQEIFYAMYRIAQALAHLGEPWPNVQDAYLKAWQFRPTRAEPLYDIAHRYRVNQDYWLGYLFAERAAQIPCPEQDLYIRGPVYAWQATDEQAVCASWIGKHREAFTLWRRVLARPDIPDPDRQRVAGNRDICVPTMIEAASSYPDSLIQSLVASPGDSEITVSLIAGPDRASTEQTLNSFLHCCLDISRVGRFLAVDIGLSPQDRQLLQERYGFLEFAQPGPGPQLADLRAAIHGRFWLHLGQGWQFFAPENFITRLTAVLQTEPQVFQVGINFTDAIKLTGTCATEVAVRRAPVLATGRYVRTDAVASGPAMFDTARLDQAGGIEGTDTDAIAALAQRAAAAGLQTASLDEVLGVSAS